MIYVCNNALTLNNQQGVFMSYTAIVFDDTVSSELESIHYGWTDKHTDGWDEKFHHLTICMGTNSKGKFPFVLGEEVVIKVVAFGYSDFATAFKCELPDGKVIANKTPHITCKVNREVGGKPKHSNDIVEWQDLEVPFEIKGIVGVCE